MKDLEIPQRFSRIQAFTLDQPVTRQIIARETGYSYTTICRKLRKFSYVKDRNYICPQVYQRILEDLEFLPRNAVNGTIE